MSGIIADFARSRLSSQVYVQGWCSQISGKAKTRYVMTLSYRVWLEHSRQRHLSRIKLAYEISPQFTSENTALRLVERFVKTGYLEECDCHRHGRAWGLKPTAKFICEFEKLTHRFIEDYERHGFFYRQSQQQE